MTRTKLLLALPLALGLSACATDGYYGGGYGYYGHRYYRGGRGYYSGRGYYGGRGYARRGGSGRSYARRVSGGRR